MSKAPAYPRLPATGGVQIHAPQSNPYGAPPSGHSGSGIGSDRPNPLDRPLSATGRVTQGLSAYRVIKNIGRGKFGVCQLVECIETGKEYVLKCISLADQTDRERLLALQEVETLKRLQEPKPHPFIVKYHENFLYQDCLYVVMQWCSGGDLHHFLRERKQTGVYLEEHVVIDWLIQLLLAIRKCHDLKIIHRDIKSQNIFLIPSKFSAAQQAKDAATAAAAQANAAKMGFPLGTTEQAQEKSNTLTPVAFSIKLGDFGISKILNSTGELAMSVVGTPYSMSPEVCENRPYSFSSDIWAIGCVLYELCVLKHAFDSNNLLGLVWKIVQEAYPPIPDLYSQDLRELVSAMLAKDPAARPTVEQILDLKFIKKRLKVQIQEKLRERSAKRASRGASGRRGSGVFGPSSSQRGNISPTESTQNVFDNQMSVSYEPSQQSGISRYRPPDFYEQNEGDGEDGDSTAGETGGSRYGQDNDGGDMGPEYSRSSSVAHFSKSTVMPSRPILNAQGSQFLGASHGHSPKTLSPSNAQTQLLNAQRAQHAALRNRGSATDDDIETQELLRSMRAGGGRRPSDEAASSGLSSASSGSSVRSFKNHAPGSFLGHTNTTAGSSGTGSGSSKRLASSIDPSGDEGGQHSPGGGLDSVTGSGSLLLGRAGSVGTRKPASGASADRRNSEQIPQRAPAFLSSPINSATSRQRGVSGSSMVSPSNSSGSGSGRPVALNIHAPVDSGEGYDISSPRTPGSFGVGKSKSEQAKATARAAQRIVKQDSFPSDEEEEGGGGGSDDEARTGGSGAVDDGGYSDDLTEALRQRHLRDDDGSDGLGESDPEDENAGEDEQEEDMVIEQLQSQLHEVGDPENDDDSPIHFLPSSSDEEDGDADGEVDGDHQEDQDEQHTKPTVQISVTRALVAPTPGTANKTTLQPLSAAAKNRAAALLASTSSTSNKHSHPSASSVAPPVSPRSAPPVQPSLREKFNAVKDRCLRAMDEGAFNEIYSHFQRAHMLSPRGSLASPQPAQTAFSYQQRSASPTADNKNIRVVRDMLRASGYSKSADVSADLIFSIEQLVYLAQVLDRPARK